MDWRRCPLHAFKTVHRPGETVQATWDVNNGLSPAWDLRPSCKKTFWNWLFKSIIMHLAVVSFGCCEVLTVLLNVNLHSCKTHKGNARKKMLAISASFVNYCQLITTTGHRRLRSSNVATCDVPWTHTTLGDRSFTVLVHICGTIYHFIFVTLNYRFPSFAGYWKRICLAEDRNYFVFD